MTFGLRAWKIVAMVSLAAAGCLVVLVILRYSRSQQTQESLSLRYFRADQLPSLDSMAAVGVIIAVAGSYHPDPSSQWLACEGQEIKKGDYPRLYSCIGDSFLPAPSSPEMFRLPAYKGIFVEFMIGNRIDGKILIGGNPVAVLGSPERESPISYDELCYRHLPNAMDSKSLQLEQLEWFVKAR